MFRIKLMLLIYFSCDCIMNVKLPNPLENVGVTNK